MAKFNPQVVLKTLQALSAALDGEPGYEDTQDLVDSAIEACQEAIDPQAELLDTHIPLTPTPIKTIPYDKGSPETYPETDDD